MPCEFSGSQGFCLRRAVSGLVLCAVLVQAVAAGNLVENGGFEQGTRGWTPADGHEVLMDGQAARSGNACLFGQVTEPQRFLRLQKTVRVRAKNLYEFHVWARATNRTKLVLWITGPAVGDKRLMVASWRGVPAKWRHYSAPISVHSDGVLRLEMIAPSSMGEPPGKMWIDDIALHEIEVPESVCVSGQQGFNDEPTMALCSDGNVYVAWVSFRDGADTLQVARYRLDAEQLRPYASWQVAGGKGTYIVYPKIVPAGDKAYLLYASEVRGDWDVFAVELNKKGSEDPVAVCPHPGVDARPVGCWCDGALWVAWESNRNGCRQVLCSSLKRGKFTPAEAVSPDGVSSYAPSLAAGRGSGVWLAWHSFSESNYDVHLRHRAGDGWSETRRLTSAPSIDRNPLLVAAKDGMWIIYENAQTGGYRIGATNRRRLIVAKIEKDGLLAPKNYAKSPLYGRCEAPAAVFDSEGRLWIAHLRPRLPRAGWDAFLTCYAGGAWMPPVRLSGDKGFDRAPSAAILGGKLLLAFQNDDIPISWGDVDKTLGSKSHIYLASVGLDRAPAAQAPVLEALTEPDEPFEAGQLRLQYGEDAPTPTIQYKGKRLKLFFGSLHEHSDVSVCNRCGDQSLHESYQHLRDIACMDFCCMTDHGYNQSPYLWGYSAKMVRINCDPGRLVTFLGQEWTSSFEKYSEKYPYGYYGHRNLVLADPYFPRWWNARNGQTPAEVWAELRGMKANFVHIPHQLADTGNVPCDWSFVDEVAQPVAEIFQVRGAYEYEGIQRQAGRTTPKGYFIQDAWARGTVVGVIASPDHGGGIGKACVYAPELTREAILDALRARRCYGTTAARIQLDFRVNGHLMGEKIPAPGGRPVEIKISVRCPNTIERIEVCRNNKYIFRKEPGLRSADVSFVDPNPLKGKSYYYCRIVQTDNEIAWSSPVWLGYK